MVGLEWFSRAAFTLASLKKYQKSPLSLLAMASYTSVYTVLPIKFDMNVIFHFPKLKAVVLFLLFQINIKFTEKR